jgi:hypothetical protein
MRNRNVSIELYCLFALRIDKKSVNWTVRIEAAQRNLFCSSRHVKYYRLKSLALLF